jgi:hypothetical protein
MLATLRSEEEGRHAGPVELGPTEPEPPAEAHLPGGIVTVHESGSPSSATRPTLPDGVPKLATPRKVPRVRWG